MAVTTNPEVFLITFGEEIAYWPAGVEANARAILAIVDREPAIEDRSASAIVMPITVANRATSIDDDCVGGIATSEMDTGEDIVMISKRLGEDPVGLMIQAIPVQDTEMIDLRLA